MQDIFFSYSFLVILTCPAHLLGGDILSRFLKALFRFLEPPFNFTHLQDSILQVHCSCQTCARANPQEALHIHQLQGHPQDKDSQVNFIHVPIHKKLCYLLALVNTFTGWIEVFPVSRETAGMKELMSEALNISWTMGLIKQQLTKLSIELRLSWSSLHPIALTCLRATQCSPTGLSPFELLYGRSFLLNHHLPAQTPPLAGYLPTSPF